MTNGPGVNLMPPGVLLHLQEAFRVMTQSHSWRWQLMVPSVSFDVAVDGTVRLAPAVGLAGEHDHRESGIGCGSCAPNESS